MGSGKNPINLKYFKNNPKWIHLHQSIKKNQNNNLPTGDLSFYNNQPIWTVYHENISFDYFDAGFCL